MKRLGRRQKALEFRTWGGKRKGAGRKAPAGKRPGVSHHGRGTHSAAHPLHVTLRLHPDIPSLRERRLYVALEEALRAGNERFGFRAVEFSVQGNHLHLLAEAANARVFSRGMQGLVIRMARAINRALERSGKVFVDRFHHRALRTPTETRNALGYLFGNVHHHAKRNGLRWKAGLVDPFSSATWFDGWSSPIESIRKAGPSPVARPETWMLRVGWRRLGLLDPSRVGGKQGALPPDIPSGKTRD